MKTISKISPRVMPRSTASPYHAAVVHVRTAGEETARACEPGDLASDGGAIAVTAETLIARDAAGPFAPLGTAIDEDAALRDDLARALPVPSLTGWLRLRLAVLAVAAVPLLMLLELDRELVAKDLLGSGRLLVDLLLGAYVVFELTRRAPRLPGIAGAALLAVGMRWLLVVTRLCGKNVHPAVWVALALSIGAGLTVFARASPSSCSTSSGSRGPMRTLPASRRALPRSSSSPRARSPRACRCSSWGCVEAASRCCRRPWCS